MNQEFKAYGSERMLWIEDYREEYADATPAHDATTSRRAIDHTGWYIDNFQSETCHGVVLTLKADTCETCGGNGLTEHGDDCPDCHGEGKGPAVYRAGVADPWNVHAVVVDMEDDYSDVDDAARAADRLAERYAEDAREDDAKFQCEQQIEDKLASIAEARRQHSALICQLPAPNAALDELVRDKLDALRVAVHSDAARIKLLRKEPWHAVEY